MPKVSVYLSDELYRRARECELSVSAVTRSALEDELAAEDNAAWIDQVRSRPPRLTSPVEISEMIVEVCQTSTETIDMFTSWTI